MQEGPIIGRKVNCLGLKDYILGSSIENYYPFDFKLWIRKMNLKRIMRLYELFPLGGRGGSEKNHVFVSG